MKSKSVIASKPKPISTCYEAMEDGVLLHIKVQPNARTSEILGVEDDIPPRVKIRLAAPPVDGKANKEILAFIANDLHVGKSHLRIIRGEKDSHKDILVQHVTVEQVQTWIQNNAQEG